MRSADLTTAARIRDAAIAQFGEHGFGVGVRAIAKVAGVSPSLVIHHFGSKEGLQSACDDYIAELVRSSKSQSLQTHDPAAWFAALAEIDDFAPAMSYLVRSMQSGSELAKGLWRTMIANTEAYLADGVAAGTIRESPDPKARAKFLGIMGGGGFLLYLQLHEHPDDMRRVLHDYANDMVLPALEVYTHGLLTDSAMYDAFVARQIGERDGH
ncbi:TetR family transcriptional regulator [Mycolicibacterium murale]|uniref:TetR family transcriptional regulator n=1 Tax=Mycolicibacterium murale TaxID=182220 RepID=A0A7I9WJS6_9MYCO|nr:TetR family transcriptional regulator [Mycolicibacterium murale]MCV7181104.1 TetR/AcrR family transcriptional regulator [Mycolicibacterium murale]GFG57839.1 TetR family transcriptional regulator [Mycolicibacterium murale]